MEQKESSTVTNTQVVAPITNAVENTIKKISIYLVIALVCVIVLNQIIKNIVAQETSNKLKGVEDKITNVDNSIKKSLDSFKNEQKSFLSRIYVIESKQQQFKNKIDINGSEISKLSIEQEKLKKIYDEKIHTVDGYTVFQLDSFFSSRYGKK
jgi:hypothetical protein